MDVRGLLDGQRDQLLDIDLDALEEELRTGGYDAAYAKGCLENIAELRAARSAIRNVSDSGRERPERRQAPRAPDAETRQPSHGTPTEGPSKDRRKAFARGLLVVRDAGGTVKAFRKLLSSCPYADERFVDENIDLFTASELTTLLKAMAFSERFLEKYFSSLDHDTLARCQEFSEGFFIAHYADLDPSTVLLRGVNEWRDKARRSRKLDTFLRIKGVRF